jgi:ABC-type transport system involved in cytochrome c biogenesis ATPase subunit
LREAILIGLRDVAASPEIWNKARLEKVTQVSLLRSVSESTVTGQFHRMTQGGARLTDYKFYFTPPQEVDVAQPPPILLFNVEPESNPPTNIHVLIGRNGIGKTYMLNRMTRALLGESGSGTFASGTPEEPTTPTTFANLVSVTFSAFDPFQPFPERKDNSGGIKYSYVGLKPFSDEGKSDKAPKNLEALTDDFANSMKACRQGAKANRWRRAFEMLGSDPIFKDAEVAGLADSEDVSGIFGKLSSGHKIVLLTITRLVETVEERTLVLIDEPEAHLHPPLLSAFVRALSDLLINRNGVAIVATHSPVVLQEVPKCCAWKLRRNGRVVNAERPEIETFGENVGVLTREIFGLEVTPSGFHKLLGEEVDRGNPLEIIFGRFNGQLGAEARAIVRALIAAKESGQKRE